MHSAPESDIRPVGGRSGITDIEGKRIDCGGDFKLALGTYSPTHGKEIISRAEAEHHSVPLHSERPPLPMQVRASFDPAKF